MMKKFDDVLTEEEKIFIKSQNLETSDFFDARGLGGPKKYHDLAKENGCRFVISNACDNGHRLKTRSGHCIICNSATIAFQKRDSIEGTIYVAVCGKYCKIGVIDNKRNTSEVLNHREFQINSEGGYGGRDEWKMIKSWKIQKCLGKVEKEAHRLLQPYKIEGKEYKYSGDSRIADELFECTIQKAVDAVKQAIASL